MTGEQEADRARKEVDLSKAFQNRLFIDDTIKKLGIIEKWNEIERSAIIDHAASFVDFQTKMNMVIEEIRKSAKDSVR